MTEATPGWTARDQRRVVTLADQLDDKYRQKQQAAVELADFVTTYMPIQIAARDKSARPLRALLARYKEACSAESTAWTRWEAFNRDLHRPGG